MLLSTLLRLSGGVSCLVCMPAVLCVLLSRHLSGVLYKYVAQHSRSRAGRHVLDEYAASPSSTLFAEKTHRLTQHIEVLGHVA